MNVSSVISYPFIEINSLIAVSVVQIKSVKIHIK